MLLIAVLTGTGGSASKRSLIVVITVSGQHRDYVAFSISQVHLSY